MSLVKFVRPHSLFNYLSQNKPIGVLDLRREESYDAIRIRKSIRISVENIERIDEIFSISRNTIKLSMIIFFVVENCEVPEEIVVKYSNCLLKLNSNDESWAHIKTIELVQFDLFYSIYRKCEPLFEGGTMKIIDHVAAYKDFPTEVIPGFLFLGNYYNATDSTVLQSLDFTHIVDVSGERSSQKCAEENNIRYLPLCIWDCSTSDIAAHFEAVFAFIVECQSQVGGRILIHCREGISRSATLVLAYLLYSKRVNTLRDALILVLDQRPFICPNEGFRAQLMQYELQLGGASSFANDGEMLGFILDRSDCLPSTRTEERGKFWGPPRGKRNKKK